MKLLAWTPALLLGVGCLLSEGVRPQLAASLRRPLDQAVPVALADHNGVNESMAENERKVAGVTSYLLRTYRSSSSEIGLYIGYYDKQTRGRTIHSPKNCLPGAGWEAVSATTALVATAAGLVTVNRYLLQSESGQRSLVLYWYQGRGRVEANEFRVKGNLMRDAALRRRSEEALIRIAVPIKDTEEAAFQLANVVASSVVAALDTALPN